jgi:molybdenum cofactor synthesis domain-containing protein
MTRSAPSAMVVTIGTELVLGEIENGNATWLCATLTQLGVTVLATTAVPDDIDRIADCVRRASAEADLVVVCGGLGGTPDDVTREGVAAAFGLECKELPEVASVLRERFGPRGLADYAARWACLPDGA